MFHKPYLEKYIEISNRKSITNVHGYILGQIPYFQKIFELSPTRYLDNPIRTDFHKEGWNKTIGVLYEHCSFPSRHYQKFSITNDLLPVVIKILSILGLDDIAEIYYKKIIFKELNPRRFQYLFDTKVFKERGLKELTKRGGSIIKMYEGYFPHFIKYLDNIKSRDDHPYGRYLYTIQQLITGSGRTQAHHNVWNELSSENKEAVYKNIETSSPVVFSWMIDNHPEKFPPSHFENGGNTWLIFKYAKVASKKDLSKALVSLYAIFDERNKQYKDRYQSFGPLVRDPSRYDIGFLWGMFLWSYYYNFHIWDPSTRKQVEEHLHLVTFPSLHMEISELLKVKVK